LLQDFYNYKAQGIGATKLQIWRITELQLYQPWVDKLYIVEAKGVQSIKNRNHHFRDAMKKSFLSF